MTGVRRDVELVSVVGGSSATGRTDDALAIAGAGSLLRRVMGILLLVTFLSALALGVYAGYGAILPPSLDISLPDGSQGLSTNALVRVTASGMSLAMDGIALRERHVGADGKVDSERLIPVSIDGTELGWLRKELSGRLILPEGGSPLSLDARYDLTIDTTVRQLTWDGLHSVPLSRHVQFKTIPTAQPLLPEQRLGAC